MQRRSVPNLRRLSECVTSAALCRGCILQPFFVLAEEVEWRRVALNSGDSREEYKRQGFRWFTTRPLIAWPAAGNGERLC